MKRAKIIALLLAGVITIPGICSSAYAKAYPDQPVIQEEYGNWLIADQLDEFDDPTGELFAMSVVIEAPEQEESSEDTEADENTETAAPVSPQEISVFYSPADYEFAFRVRKDGKAPGSFENASLKYKIDDTVYTGTLEPAENGDLYLIQDSGSEFEDLQTALRSADSFKCIIYLDEDKYSFTLDTEGFHDCDDILYTPMYEDALTLYEAGNYEEAVEAFTALGDYKDSPQQAENASNAILENAYAEAVALYEAGSYEEAAEAFTALGDYKDSLQLLEQCEGNNTEQEYQNALSLKDAGQYQDAIAAFTALDSYKDSVEQIDAIRHDPAFYPQAEIGDIVYLGTYEQDNDLTDGEEEVAWIVLDKEGTDLLLFSCYALDNVEFSNVSDASYTGKWDACSLRIWMNRTFLESVFSQEEMAAIRSTSVVTDNNTDTSDSLFLLDKEQAVNLFKTDAARQCQPTAYASAQGVLTDGNNCQWWLRSLGTTSSQVCIITENGAAASEEKSACTDGIGLRPAMWVDAQQLSALPSVCPDKTYGTIAGANVVPGKEISFGTYEQDNDTSNGTEPIIWTVVDVEGSQALVVSKYALDCQPFNSDKGGHKWDISTLRQWLNSDFLNAAFSADEQARIPAQTIITKNNEDTLDRLFLLDADDAEAYFPSLERRRCAPTAYAIAQGVTTNDSTCTWYLRSIKFGPLGSIVNSVAPDGMIKTGITSSGAGIKDENIGVRPALWIQLDP